MKLRNKKTGEIRNVNHAHILVHFNDGETISVNTLAKLTDEWEDYEEPKEYWYIDTFGKCDISFETVGEYKNIEAFAKEIGNYFATKEEAERAVEKLKAWKRLKDAGFKFNNWIYDYREAENENERGLSIGASYARLSKIDANDINLLFGGEEC